jgi:hypothetical protein
LAYKFTPGPTFAYRVEILAERADQTERFLGTPVITVKSVEDVAELAVVGRLACAVKPSGDEEYEPRPERDIWIGTRLAIDPSGQRLSGRADHNERGLPDSLRLLITPRRLLFVELPATVTGRYGSGGSVWVTLNSPNPSNRIVNFKRVLKERSVHTTEGPPREWRFTSVSRFDRQRGLLLDTEAAYHRVEDGNEAEPVKINVRLLEGEELQQAYAQAQADWKLLPPGMEPKEFRRVRLNWTWRDNPQPHQVALKSADQATPGLVVAYYSPELDCYCLAEVVEVLSEHKVKIRYRGSGEELDVHPGALAIPPADKLPKP